MANLEAGIRVRVVAFDEAGLTGSVYKGFRNPVGHHGTILRYEPEFTECPWVVDLDGSRDFLLPDRYLEEELEVVEG